MYSFLNVRMQKTQNNDFHILDLQTPGNEWLRAQAIEFLFGNMSGISLCSYCRS